ncbi:ribonuclease domain-containing protein [unidentified bacterial endosymbiont]|jgi:copper chaperone CopZ|uniref:ribonuclease domain-containing protein n=1 Tax=unidentified bacterial endosymbiont TaxID=2355 RepID=UPI00209F5377|nr:ribonuclease domain-containing protein [unidentified bacterial endosymbiont]
MKKAIRTGSLVLCMALFSHFSTAAETVTCEKEVNEINTFLNNNGSPGINNVADFSATLRTLNTTGRLPAKYITSEEAKRLGWSGSDSETLWGLKPTHNKWIGGDAYQHKTLPASVKWYSADVDVSRGYRSPKRLVYTLSGQQRFFTPDNYQHFVEVTPCQ